MTWRNLLNVQNTEKGFFPSSNSYGIPDIKADEFEIKELIPYRVDGNRNGTAHFFLDDYRFERCWKNPDSQISELNNELKTQQSKNKHKSLTLVWVLLLCGLFISLFVWFAFFVVNNDSEFFKLLWSFIKKKAWPLLVVIVGWPISAFIQSNIDFFFKKNSDE